MKVLFLNGPNLNLLGQREPEIYGSMTLADIEDMVREHADRHSVEVAFHQSNHEGALVDYLQERTEGAQGIIINPGAYSHTSIAILDALNAFEAPVMEVHISQIHKRETFRHHSYVSHRADAVIAGLGLDGYVAGVRRICSLAGAAG